jgi:uncharacterized protein
MNEPRGGIVRDLAALADVYGAPGEQACAKEVDYLHPHYRKFVEHAPFFVLATCGGTLDASPRGDAAGFVHVQDEKTLLIPDRRGNNRIDSLRNIVGDARVALLFLVPGVAETLRVRGRAEICVDDELLARFAVEGRRPRSVLIVTIDSVFFQCARAVLRARLWDMDAQVDRSRLPSIGTILAELSHSRLGGEQFDRALQERLRSTLY